MKKQISIRSMFNTPNASARSGLRGSLFALSENNGRRTFISDMSLPVQDYTDNNIHDIYMPGITEHGEYLLQLHLPDGDIINKTFNYDGSKAPPLDIQLPYRGKRESLSWQTQIKGFLPATYQPDTVGFVQFTSDPVEVYLADASNLMSTSDNQYEFCSKLISNDSSVPFNFNVQAGWERLLPTEEIDGALLFVLGGGDIQWEPGPSHFSRPVLIINSGTGIKWMTIPFPWKYLGKNLPIEILLTPIKSGHEITISVQEPMINGALGYLYQGASYQGSSLLQTERILFDKISSPLTASLAGYLLFQSYSTTKYSAEDPSWCSWITNLSNWFEWLPDGAILEAALFTYFKIGERDEAFYAAMNAYTRGLPYFSFGLEILLEVMYFFANEGESQAENAVVHLEKIASKTDPSSSFSTIQVAQIHLQRTPKMEFADV